MVYTVVLNQASEMKTSDSNTGELVWSALSTLAIDVNVTDKQGTNPTLQVLADRLMADGATFVPVWDSAAFSVSGASGGTPVQKSTSIGPGLAIDQEIGRGGRVRWAIGGTSSPGAKFSLSVQGK